MAKKGTKNNIRISDTIGNKLWNTVLLGKRINWERQKDKNYKDTIGNKAI